MIITKAMLLCAGFGVRLRPITLTTPKPLLPLNGELVIDSQMKYLASNGICDVAVNLHHLGEMIKEHVGSGSRYKLKVEYFEEPEILGTGGGIKNAEVFFDTEPFIVLNSDSLINADIGKVVAHHFEKDPAATMVVKRISEDNGFTPISVDKNGNITGFESGTYYYTGLQVLTKRMLDILPPKDRPSCLINDGYKKLLSAHAKVSAFTFNGYACDIGTPKSYAKAQQDLKNGIIR